MRRLFLLGMGNFFGVGGSKRSTLSQQVSAEGKARNLPQTPKASCSQPSQGRDFAPTQKIFLISVCTILSFDAIPIGFGAFF